MSIASEITRLQTAKANIKSAIEGKGVTVSSSAKLDDYANLISSIETASTVYTYIAVTSTLNSTERATMQNLQIYDSTGQSWTSPGGLPEPTSQYYYRFTDGYFDNSNEKTILGLCIGDANETKIFDFMASTNVPI
jgi:hypothetical protein